MSKKKEIPTEGGKVNWDKLEQFTKKGEDTRKKKKKAPKDRSLLEAVAKNLSEEEKAMPYPDEFLAEIKIMRNEFDGSELDLDDMEEDHGDDDDE